ncbi:PREDICTED: interferon alpha-inducible protein 27-like protein 2-like [Chrysochloris asiatica]|uniref:Interferon alpha-inducible protein 27-like protein 2-like n=1 Tax=Chrysochloris asiatica TaxID=185453 RepID=A0A9B0T3Z6_CHRAS|nr:PREDICTED: interferon alpha-inducible protein 27-like protein 2-like [Chrysochloris asiatica]
MAFAVASAWASSMAAGLIAAAGTVSSVGTLASGTTLVGVPTVGKCPKRDSWVGPFPSPSLALILLSTAVVALGSMPVVLSTLGFTQAGIAASSVAAKMMSMAAIANGGGVAAGSLVATLQSLGAAGLSLSTKIVLASTGCTLGALLVP